MAKQNYREFVKSYLKYNQRHGEIGRDSFLKLFYRLPQYFCKLFLAERFYQIMVCPYIECLKYILLQCRYKNEENAAEYLQHKMSVLQHFTAVFS